MKISHVFGKKKIEENKAGNVALMLTNKIGGYSFFFNNPISKYNGVFFRTSSLFKAIEHIGISDKTNISEVTNKFYTAERVKEGVKEIFFMPHFHNSLVYETSKESEIEIFLDVKKAYDERSLGRVYEISGGNGMIIVKFTKKTDVKEDKSHGEEEYSVYIAIKADNKEYKKIDKWELRKYAFDEKRNSTFERYVYNAMAITAKKIVFSFSENKEAAVKEAAYVYENSELLKKKQRGYFSKFADNDFALFCAKSSLDSLVVHLGDEAGIYSGFPWFFQIWTRDEAISLKALMLMKKREMSKNTCPKGQGVFFEHAQKCECLHISDISKKILRRQVNNLIEDGRIQNIIEGGYSSISGDSPIASADGVGWVFKRIADALSIKKSEFSKKEKGVIAVKLEESIQRLRSSYEEEYLIKNNELETWMDTAAENGNDKRAGFRIEIQALQLAMYKLAYELTRKKEYKALEAEMKSKVKERFWNGRILADGAEDATIRPNIFLACYIYPELLTKEEWETCFENALPRLWLDWGGLATIDKSSPLFKDEYSGETPWSYHRGDSWFWVNNLAAIVMLKINKEKFSSYIEKITEASREDILWKGIIGAHSELSSAKEQRAEGCLNQSWSSAMFVELMDEIAKDV